MINAIVTVTGGRFGANFVYSCPDCGCEFRRLDDKRVVHPSYRGIFRNPVGCFHAGKVFTAPVVTVPIFELRA